LPKDKIVIILALFTVQGSFDLKYGSELYFRCNVTTHLQY